ncbi:MAG: cobalt transporter CbiN [Oscillospiraceae bacterium]|nr:cobalt transporter CbiN [Oscillospiraceae bacterium]
MKQNVRKVLLILVICVLIAVIPLLVLNSEFGGSDDAAETVVSSVDPTYQPWAESLITLPGPETESLLFCLEAAIGSGILCFCFGYLAARKKYSTHGGGAQAGQTQASS